MTQAEFLAGMLIGAMNARDSGSPIHPQAAAAHAANETGFGKSGLSKEPYRNLFGVKATGVHTPFWRGESVSLPTWEVVNGERVDIMAPFRVYASYADAFGDYGDVIRRVYPAAARASTDLEFLHALFVSGPRRWATDPSAFDKAARIIGRYSDILYDDSHGAPHVAHTVVLHGFPLALRWAVLTRSPAELRGSFVWRSRGDKLDLRRVRER